MGKLKQTGPHDQPMGGLKQKLLREIEHAGPLPISRYMEACLMDREHGFYCREDPIGAAGSFTTAPEISQMFGELIGLALCQAWMDQGSPPCFALAELGPGRGVMMADILRATRVAPGFNEAARLFLVERSDALRRSQARRLVAHSPVWCPDVDELPEMPLFLVANEFFDALPIRQFRRRTIGWQEIMIDAEAGHLRYTHRDCSRCQDLGQQFADIPPNAIVELRPEAERIIGRIAGIITRHGGGAIIVDYGEDGSIGNTLQAVRDHRPAEPLDEPGAADLTAHVDFAALARSARGTAVGSLTTQGEFLARLGIRQRARILAKSASGAALREHQAALNRLVAPDQMGRLFKVIGLHPPCSAPLPGFAS